MIFKVVERDSADPLGVDIYAAQTEIQTLDRESATAFDHFFHYLRALCTTNTHRHPAVGRFYGYDDSLAEVRATVLADCHTILGYVEKIQNSPSELTRAHLLEEMRARFPYLESLPGEPRV